MNEIVGLNGQDEFQRTRSSRARKYYGKLRNCTIDCTLDSKPSFDIPTRIELITFGLSSSMV